MEPTFDRSQSLTRTQLYLFDTMGFLRLPGFLSPEHVDHCMSQVLSLSSRPMEGKGDKIRFDELALRNAYFSKLARDPKLLRCIEPLINQPYRLIESYALRHQPASSFYLHNGMSEILRYGGSRVVQRNMSFQHTFHNGKLYCMFVKVLLYLTDVQIIEDGPFCYLQGSHKANFPYFEETEARPPLTKEHFPSLEYVLVKSGDALLVNEALLHGTLQKTTTTERLVMAFSYAPTFVTDWKEIDLTSMDIGNLGHY